MNFKKVILAVTPYSITRCRMLAGIFEYANRFCRWNMDMIPDSDLVTVESVRQLSKTGVSGLIISHVTDWAIVDELDRTGIKTVVIDTPDYSVPPPRANISFHDGIVIGENFGALGFRYLHSCGKFRHFGFVAAAKRTSWSENRMRGFLAAATVHDEPCSAFTAVGERRDAELAEWLTSIPKPAAIMAANDWTALEVAGTCNRARIPIPHKVCILGVDDSEFVCTNSRPTLSSVKIDHEAIGAEFAKQLRKMLSARTSPPQNIVLSPQNSTVVERGSTNAPLPAAHLIQRALDYIREHAAEGIGPGDVARHLHVSLRLATLRFRELHSESMSQTILRRKMELVCAKLRSTEADIGVIAASCGFAGRRSLERQFKARFGMTMRAWRQCTLPEAKL